MPCTEHMDFLRIAHMIFSTGVWENKLNLNIFNIVLIIPKLKSGIMIVLLSLP
jgi:hypothetical protein